MFTNYLIPKDAFPSVYYNLSENHEVTHLKFSFIIGTKKESIIIFLMLFKAREDEERKYLYYRVIL